VDRLASSCIAWSCLAMKRHDGGDGKLLVTLIPSFGREHNDRTCRIPGDPALLRLRNFATADQLQQLRLEMGLDKPSHERFWLYLQGLLQGDLGRSWRTGDTVTNDLKARFPATLELGLYSTILSILVGIPIGVITAARKDSYLDYGGKLYGVLGVAMPLFWLGLILVYVFYYLLGIAPAPTGRLDLLVAPPPRFTGLYVVDSLLSGDMEALWSGLSHLRNMLRPPVPSAARTCGWSSAICCQMQWGRSSRNRR
jgi:ABC-type dipeptide/oligopeptide/nickel transport system permease component